MKTEIKFVGVGGQGVLLASTILAKGAAVFDGYFAVMTEKYTSDMRGGEVFSDIILSSEKVMYPLVENSDYLIVLSQEGYEKYCRFLKPSGVLIYDSDLVTRYDDGIERFFSASFNAIAANTLKNRATINMIALGFVCETMKVVEAGSLKKVMAEEIAEKHLPLNLEAFDIGEGLKREREAI